MELHLTEQQQNSLASLSAQTGRSADDLLRDALDRMLAQERWFQDQVQIGIDQIARGEFLEEEQMDERIARMLRA
jgi:predicted transcriptional regulator